MDLSVREAEQNLSVLCKAVNKMQWHTWTDCVNSLPQIDCTLSPSKRFTGFGQVFENWLFVTFGADNFPDSGGLMTTSKMQSQFALYVAQSSKCRSRKQNKLLLLFSTPISIDCKSANVYNQLVESGVVLSRSIMHRNKCKLQLQV
jgi:hypothetical protein